MENFSFSEISPFEGIYASAGDSRTIKLWNASDHKSSEYPTTHRKSIYCLNKFGKNKLLSGSFDNSIILWELSNIEEELIEKRVYKGHSSFIWTLESSKKHQKFFSGSQNKEIKIWDYKSDGERGFCKGTLSYHNGWIRSLKFNDNNGQLYSSSADKSIAVYNLSKQKVVSQTIQAYSNSVTYSMDINYGKGMLFSAGKGEIKVWDLRKKIQEKNEINSINLLKSNVMGMVVKYVPKNDLVVVASGEEIEIFDIRQPDHCLNHWIAHKNRSNNNHHGLEIVHTKNNDYIITSFFSTTIKTWNFQGELISANQSSKNIYDICYLGKLETGNHSVYYDKKIASEVSTDKEERISFFLSSFLTDNYDFEIMFSNGFSMKCFKSLMIDSSLDLSKIKKIEISENLNVSEEFFIKILLGIEIVIPIEVIFDYYLLFYHLKMKERQFLICKNLENIKSLKNLLILFLKTKERFENTLDQQQQDEDEEDLTFEKEIEVKNEKKEELPKEIELNSDFTFKLLKIFKKREKEILINWKLLSLFGKYDVISLIQALPKKNNQYHSEILNHRTIFQNNLKELYTEKKFSTATLKTNDSTKVLVHKEVCVLHSNFFSRMLKFEGKETEELKTKGYISLEFFNSNQLHSYLEYIYTGKISSDDFIVLFSLLNHANMYQEHYYQKSLFEKIKLITSSISKEKFTFRRFIDSYGYLFESPEIEEILVKHWQFHSDFSEQEIKDMIKISKNKISFVLENKKLRENNQVLIKKVEELEDSLKLKNEEISKLKSILKKKE